MAAISSRSPGHSENAVALGGGSNAIPASGVALLSHEPALWIRSIHASAAWNSVGALMLEYRLDADLGSLRIPRTGAGERIDGLWHHTCFEAFVQGCDAPAYREFNFSPSGAWQAYAFSDYRQGGPLALSAAPRIECTETGALRLCALVSPPDLPPGQCLRLGLTAVLESEAGKLFYWALAHPPGRPDFHHTGGFALELVRP